MDKLALLSILVVPIVLLLVLSRTISRQGPWLMAWLRGTVVLSTVALSYASLITTIEILKLDAYPSGEKVAEVLIDDGVDKFLVTVASENNEISSLMNGDAVKLTYRSMKLSGILNHLAPNTLVTLQSLDSRYYDYESQNQSKNVDVQQSSFKLPMSDKTITAWGLLEPLRPLLSRIGMHTDTISVEYIPLRNEAIYELMWQGYGFDVVAANMPAREAMYAGAPVASN